MALTITSIKRLKPPATGHTTIWDANGLGLRITAPGHKSWIVFKRFRGRPITYTIGAYGVFTIKQAREEANEILRDIARNIDPRDRKRMAKVTLREVADTYMARPKLKQSSKDQIDRHIKTTFEAWKHRPIAAIAERDCLKRYTEIKTKGLSGERKGGSPGQANQAFSVLSALINFAMRTYRKEDGSPAITYNPVLVLKDVWQPLKPRDSYIKPATIGAVWNFLKTTREQAYNRAEWSSVDLVMWLLLTGCRVGEATQLQWSNVSTEEGWWHIPDPKNRRPIWLPLSTQAVALLEQRPRVQNNPYVFPGKTKSSHLKDPRAMWSRISKIAGEPITAHDCRRTFAITCDSEFGFELYRIKSLLGHALPGVTENYLNRKRLTYMRAEVQKIADWIEEKARIASGDNVVALRA